MPIPNAPDPGALKYLDRQLRGTVDGWETILQQTVTILAHENDNYDWTGVYLVEADNLILGPFVGAPTEHRRIPIGRGICGAAAADRATIVVDDVGSDPRYLACFATTLSEIVVPILDGDRVIGEIDVDSDRPAAFGDDDRQLLEAVADRLARLAPKG